MEVGAVGVLRRRRRASRSGRRSRDRSDRTGRPRPRDRRSCRKSPAGTRPSPVSALSLYVAIPSICQSGRNRLGKSTGARPNTRRRPPIHPRALSRCTMCVYSCENTRRSQSSVFPDRAVARRRGSGDLDQIVRRRRRPAVREVGLIHEDDVHAAARRAELRRGASPATSSAMRARRRASASSPWWK